MLTASELFAEGGEEFHEVYCLRIGCRFLQNEPPAFRGYEMRGIYNGVQIPRIKDGQ